MSSITAILPAYNEEVAIGSVVLRSRQHDDRVIVVDDGSSDRTAEVAALAGAEVLRHAENCGKGAALRTGFAAVDGADVIVTIDTDGLHSLTDVSSSCAPDGAQLDPADIPKLVETILAGEAEMVNGSRYLNGNKKDTPLYRRVGQRAFYAVTVLDSGLSMTDSQSGFQAFAGGVRDVFSFRQDGLAIESEMLADAAQAGSRAHGARHQGAIAASCRRARALVELDITTNLIDGIEVSDSQSGLLTYDDVESFTANIKAINKKKYNMGVRNMMSDVVKRTIEVFYPAEDSNEALNRVVLEWLDSKTSKLEEKIMEFERKYGTEFTEFDERIKKEGVSFEEEDDWIDWGDYIELLESLKTYRRDVLSQLKRL